MQQVEFSGIGAILWVKMQFNTAFRGKTQAHWANDIGRDPQLKITHDRQKMIDLFSGSGIINQNG